MFLLERYLVNQYQSHTLFTVLCCRKKTPPRALLDLVPAEMYSREELLHRVSSIAMFKAPSSWSMASSAPSSPRSYPQGAGSESTTNWIVAGGSLVKGGCEDNGSVVDFQPSFTRAKLASGIPMLIGTVEHTSLLSQPTYGSRRYVLARKKKRKKSIIQKWKRMILGTTKAKAS